MCTLLISMFVILIKNNDSIVSKYNSIEFIGFFYLFPILEPKLFVIHSSTIVTYKVALHHTALWFHNFLWIFMSRNLFFIEHKRKFASLSFRRRNSSLLRISCKIPIYLVLISDEKSFNAKYTNFTTNFHRHPYQQK